MRLPTLLLGLLLAALPCDAAVTAENVLAGLNRPDRFRTSFVQTKTMTGIKKELRAEGILIYISGKGALWKVEKPRPRCTVLSAKVEGGSKAEREVADVVAAVLTGDPTGLSRHFDMEVAEVEGRRRVKLIPKVAALRDVIAALTLDIEGGHVGAVAIEEASGGHINLRFGKPEAPYEPSAEEAELLESGGRR